MTVRIAYLAKYELLIAQLDQANGLAVRKFVYGLLYTAFPPALFGVIVAGDKSARLDLAE